MPFLRRVFLARRSDQGYSAVVPLTPAREGQETARFHVTAFGRSGGERELSSVESRPSWRHARNVVHLHRSVKGCPCSTPKGIAVFTDIDVCAGRQSIRISGDRESHTSFGEMTLDFAHNQVWLLIPDCFGFCRWYNFAPTDWERIVDLIALGAVAE